MHFTLFNTLILAICSFGILTAAQRSVLSAPSNGGVTMKQIRNPRWRRHRTNLTEVYVDGLRKHHMPIPKLNATVTPRMRRAASSTVTGYIDGTSAGQYVIPVSVGAPAKQLNVVFDTGSGVTWFHSDLEPASQSAGHSIYNISASTSASVFSGQTFNVNYVAGSTYGNMYTDVFYVGTLGIAGEPVGAAVGVDISVSSITSMDGIFALNLSPTDAESPTPQQSWLGFVASLRLGLSVFSANLHLNGPGTYTFGQQDTSQYSGALSYVPMHSEIYPGSWCLYITGYSIGVVSGTATPSSIKTISLGSIVDTGSPYFYLPSAMLTEYFSQVTGSYFSSGQWFFPCSAVLPRFTFRLEGGYVGYMPGNYVNYGVVSGTTCHSSIQVVPDGFPSIIGIPLLQTQFVTFDYYSKRMGWAAKSSLP